MPALYVNHKIVVHWDRLGKLTNPSKPYVVMFAYYEGVGDRPHVNSYRVSGRAIDWLKHKLVALGFSLDLQYDNFGYGVATLYPFSKYIVLYANGVRVGSFEYHTAAERQAILDEVRKNNIGLCLIQKDQPGHEFYNAYPIKGGS